MQATSKQQQPNVTNAFMSVFIVLYICWFAFLFDAKFAVSVFLPNVADLWGYTVLHANRILFIVTAVRASNLTTSAYVVYEFLTVRVPVGSRIFSIP
jgi:hypothetical protein